MTQSTINEFTWVVRFILGRNSLFWNQALTQRLNTQTCSIHMCWLTGPFTCYLHDTRILSGLVACQGMVFAILTQQGVAVLPHSFPTSPKYCLRVSCVMQAYFFSCNSGDATPILAPALPSFLAFGLLTGFLPTAPLGPLPGLAKSWFTLTFFMRGYGVNLFFGYL